MIAGNHLPMLGTLTPERWGARFRRIDKPTCRKEARLQVQAARRYEERLFASDIAHELAELAELEIADNAIYDLAGRTYHAGDNYGLPGDVSDGYGYWGQFPVEAYWHVAA